MMELLPWYLAILMISFVVSKEQGLNVVAPLFLIVLAATSTSQTDYASYLEIYNQIGNGYYDSRFSLGWIILCAIGNMLNLSYAGFYCCVLIMSFALISKTIARFTDKPGIVWFLYLIYPALIDCVQVRYLLAGAIVLYSIRFLVEPTRKSLVAYAFCIVLSFFIHSAMLFFAIFLIIPTLKKISDTLIISISAIFALLVYYIAVYQRGVLALFLSARDMSYFYFHSRPMAVAVYACFWAAMYMIVRFIDRKTPPEKRDTLQAKYISTLRRINALMALTILFLAFDDDFLRLQRTLLVLEYIAVSLSLGLLQSTRLHVILYFACTVVVVASACYYVGSTFDSVVEPLLSFEGFEPLLK